VSISNGTDRLRPPPPPVYSCCHLPLALLTCLLLIASACSTPVGVKRIDPHTINEVRRILFLHKAAESRREAAESAAAPTQETHVR